MTTTPHSDNAAPDSTYGRKEKFYGQSAGLCVEETEMTEQGQVYTTANLELAKRVGEKIDWGKKTIFQLNRHELPVLIAVCFGLMKEITFKRGGKGVKIERQPGKLFIQSTAGPNSMVNIPLEIGQCFRLNAFLLSILQNQTGIEDANILLAALRSAAALNRS